MHMDIDDIEIGQIVTVIGEDTNTRINVEEVDRDKRLVTCSWFGGPSGEARQAKYRPEELRLTDKF